MAMEVYAGPASAARRTLPMSMTEIAELAQVKRPVVTTWRRRYPDFPAPVAGDAASPQFDSRQIADWLITTGRDKDGRVEADLGLYTLAGLGDGLPPRDLIALVTALICVRAQDDEPLAGAGDLRRGLLRRAARLDPNDRYLRSELALLPADPQWLAAAVDELVEAAWGSQEAFERILSAGNRFKAGDLYVRTVPPELARLVAGLSGASERARDRTIWVCDPFAGPGDLLTAVADTAGPDYDLTFQAAEADGFLARLTARRLSVQGVGPDGLQLAISASLPEKWTAPDVIVTQIPYVPGESRSPAGVMDHLDDISLRLAPGSTAVVLGPADVLAGDLPAYSQAELTRAELLSSGTVEAIIKLPGGLTPFRPGYELALWVLTSACDSPWPGWVLLADVSDRELTGEVTAALVEDVVTWRRDGYRPHAHTRVFGVQVKVSDLVNELRPLTARRSAAISRCVTTGSDLVSRVTDIEAGLNRLAANATSAKQSVQSQVAAGVPASLPRQTIGALAKSRRLIIKPGARLRGVSIGGDGHHDVLGVPELLGRVRCGNRRIDRIALAAHQRAQLTEPGDVIVTTTPEFRVLIDHDGLAVAEFPAKVLRIPQTECDSFTPRTLAGLLAGQVPSLRPAGAVRPARRLEEHEIPLLTPAEVGFLDQFLTDLDARHETAQQELDLLAELRDVTLSGLLDGRLTFTASPTVHAGQ